MIKYKIIFFYFILPLSPAIFEHVFLGNKALITLYRHVLDRFIKQVIKKFKACRFLTSVS